MTKRALLSVYDKEGIVEFALGLRGLGWEIISTGGTYKILKDSGIEVIDVETVTGFPEMLEGRVKTLNPYIHGGILFRRDEKRDANGISQKGIKAIDMVVNNLYPFEESLKMDLGHNDMLENIDIGGPSMIRAAAKNYQDVIVITSPARYGEVIGKLRDGILSSDDRKSLAAEAFGYTAYYDSLISQYFNRIIDEDFPDRLTKTFEKSEILRYGENPHQKASYYKEVALENRKREKIKQIHGKKLSYNNYTDIYQAVRILKEFEEPTAVAVKHGNPCGIGSDEIISHAFKKAYDCDSISIFGGIVSFNREVDNDTAVILSKIFLEIIIAPSYSKEALEILTKKENLRIIIIDNIMGFEPKSMEIRQILGGVLVQDRDNYLIDEDLLKVVTKRKPTVEEFKNLIFAWRAAKNISSNGIVIAKDGATLGIGSGEVRRIWAVEKAVERATSSLEGAVMASDGFFFADTAEYLHGKGVDVIIQPGGSVKDKEVIEYADANNMCVIFTGIRHFKH